MLVADDDGRVIEQDRDHAAGAVLPRLLEFDDRLLGLVRQHVRGYQQLVGVGHSAERCQLRWMARAERESGTRLLPCSRPLCSVPPDGGSTVSRGNADEVGCGGIDSIGFVVTATHT